MPLTGLTVDEGLTTWAECCFMPDMGLRMWRRSSADGSWISGSSPWNLVADDRVFIVRSTMHSAS